MASVWFAGDGDGDGDNDNGDYGDNLGVTKPQNTTIQIALSVVLGLAALLTFCILRTRWPSLYAARKRTRGEATPLPDLPDTFFGWIPTLWRVTEQQVLASAGLDAYVFLRFFKLAIKFLSVTFFFALVVIKPVHDANPERTKHHYNKTESNTIPSMQPLDLRSELDVFPWTKKPSRNTEYLWMYLVFAYLFTALAIYLLVTETERIISIRQQYLGSKCTISDRTIRLSGIPPYLRSEEKIKQYIEALQIGKVDSVTLCRVWQELDDKMDQRKSILRRLEESWSFYIGYKQDGLRNGSQSLPRTEPEASDQADEHNSHQESAPLLNGQRGRHTRSSSSGRPRPQTTVRYGLFKLRSRVFDSIDYYEEKLRQLDEEIQDLRKKDFMPTALAYVTMDSVAACQMAVQAVLDPSPMTLIAKSSSEPKDVIWRNTYMPRWQRMSRGWVITIAITFLTVFWSLLLVPIAGALSLASIREVSKPLADFLESHEFLASLVQTQLPTLITSLLFVIVPFLYDWLANLQGMTSQADVDQSVISKNFFFLFFNYFIIFTVLGTFSNFWDFFSKLQDSLKDTTRIANLLAASLQKVLGFYTNLVILQGIGLYPFRLLEFGSVFLYPFFRMVCKTPRDYAELAQPPVFGYGFFMPTVMLIFIICIVYSIVRDSWQILLAGLFYFTIGGFVTKYQLLYAMDHRQQSTGRSWMMVCNRMIVGIILFQITILGQLALNSAIKRSVVVVPLLIATVWFSYSFSRSYDPLLKHISLGSIERRKADLLDSPIDPDGWGEQIRNTDDDSATGDGDDSADRIYDRFVNPSLVEKLEDIWISDSETRTITQEGSQATRTRLEGVINANV